jgi:hypothetical protein
MIWSDGETVGRATHTFVRLKQADGVTLVREQCSRRETANAASDDNIVSPLKHKKSFWFPYSPQSRHESTRFAKVANW